MPLRGIIQNFPRNIAFFLFAPRSALAEPEKIDTVSEDEGIVDFKIRLTLPWTHVDFILGWGGPFTATWFGGSVGLEIKRLFSFELGFDYLECLYFGGGIAEDGTEVEENFDRRVLSVRAGLMPAVGEFQKSNMREWVLQVGGLVGYRLDVEKSKNTDERDMWQGITVIGAFEATHFWNKKVGMSVRLISDVSIFPYVGILLVGLGINVGLVF